MNCHDAHKRLNEYLDGELPDSVRSNIELHLHGCTSCRERLAELQHVDHLFRSMTSGGFPTPPDLVHRALAELPPTGLTQSAPAATRRGQLGRPHHPSRRGSDPPDIPSVGGVPGTLTLREVCGVHSDDHNVDSVDLNQSTVTMVQ